LAKVPLIVFVKPRIFLAVALSMVALRLSAAEPGQAKSTSSNTSAPPSSVTIPSSTPTEDAQIGRSDSFNAKNSQLSDALNRPSSVKKIFSFPRRVLHLVNPFAASENKVEVLQVREYSPRAWSSSISWRVGGSAFPDELTHESTLGLNLLSKR
jgi:hypothetical protein